MCLSVTDRWLRTSRSLLEASNFFRAQSRTHLEDLSPENLGFMGSVSCQDCQKCSKDEAPHCSHRLRQGIPTSRMYAKWLSIATRSKLRVDLMEKRHSTAQ